MTFRAQTAATMRPGNAVSMALTDALSGRSAPALPLVVASLPENLPEEPRGSVHGSAGIAPMAGLEETLAAAAASAAIAEAWNAPPPAPDPANPARCPCRRDSRAGRGGGEGAAGTPRGAGAGGSARRDRRWRPPRRRQAGRAGCPEGAGALAHQDRGRGGRAGSIPTADAVQARAAAMTGARTGTWSSAWSRMRSPS